MKRFRIVDNALGWLSFLIAAFVYCSTIEPTASFWDCPEFISTGYKLEIGHPPGAPFFMLTANLFSQFVSDPSDVARMVNTMSALLSAATILFLFWSITHLVRRLLLRNDGEMTLGKMISIEASGLVGALIYTFSDTFWFSAVEGEVYAYSSAFTAVVFWLILKWEEHADEPHSDRWLVLIMYMTGLSIGVHLLNLLCLPAIVLVYYYRKFPNKQGNADLKGSLIALGISIVILAAVLYGVVPGIVRVGGWFELLFVNVLGCPFNTGEIIYIALLVATIIWAIYETHVQRNEKRQNIAFLASVAMLGIPFYGFGISSVVIGIIVLAILWFVVKYKNKKGVALVSARIKNTSLLCMLMLMIGYSSYALIVIRSSANPPMDQNSPEDIFTLGEYLSREQYGSRPLLYGQAYTSQVQLEKDGDMCRPVSTKGAPVYQRKEKASADEKDSYFVVRTKDEYKYAQNMLFPRMYSSAHSAAYESWMGGVEGTQQPYDRCGEMISVKVPTMLENIRFFLSYQCNFMYWRYFMWNFAGRQNDLQGNGELEHGNWITGFDWFDNLRLGDQSKLPDDLKNNKGHNVFYCLPLLLGLIGLFWQSLRKGQNGIRQFWVVFFLFFMTGLAIVIYLNQTPGQPRERDYAYAGSFYAFAIWCGMGVAAIIDEVTRRLKGKETAVAAIVGVVCLLVPVQMASQTWDDHDRSGRYTCRDFGRNYLMSLEEKGNPIIFTNGDNDTFPLWYNQDVEGERTDARVCNLSYLQTDWYIDQMLRPAYDSPSLPISWSRLEYCAGTNEYVTIEPALKESIAALYDTYPEEARKMFGENPYELKNILKYWVRNNVSKEQKEVMKLLLGDGDLNVIPTDTVYVTIDKEAVKKSCMLMATDSIPDRMVISLKGKRALYKGDLMMLELIANCNWTRPIYVALTVGEDNYMNLGDNFVQEGLVNRITPFTTNVPGAKNFDTKRTYDRLMHKFRFGGLETPGIYLDETVMRMCWTHRKTFVQLAMNLVNEGDDKKAAEVLAYLDKHIPEYNVPINFWSGSLDEARVYAHLGQNKKAMSMYKELFKISYQYNQWYCSLEDYRFLGSQRDILRHFYIMQQTLVEAEEIDSKWAQQQQLKMSALLQLYRSKGGSFGDEEEGY
ncbi:MAG: DUF2723 domain-containing protein [Prevotella sp.]|nr:DUF2723 domain-containing protein [Prevotella sp.]